MQLFVLPAPPLLVLALVRRPCAAERFMELGSAVSAHRCSSYTATYTHCSIGFSPRVRTASWIRAAAEGDDGGADRRRRGASFAADGPRVVEVTAAPVATSGGGAGGAAGSAGFGARDAELAMWDKLGAVVRLSYGIGQYLLPPLLHLLVQFVDVCIMSMHAFN